MPTFSDTAEQTAIFAHLRDTREHLIINALAGTGKSTTLEKALPLLSGTSLVLAFNRSIADEWKQRVGAAGIMVASSTSAATVHSHGLAAFRNAGAKPQTQGGKLHFLMKDQMRDYAGNDPVQRNARHIVRMVSLAKSNGFGLTSCQPTLEQFPSITDRDAWQALIDYFSIDLDFEGELTCERAIDEAIELLVASNKKLGMIDFDDMIYLPMLFNMRLRLYTNVLIDEAQDINATRRELAFRSLEPKGRIIAVGDKHQAIYGFTGADAQSISNIAKRCQTAVVLPLSTCWRCDDEVLEEARKVVPQIKTAPAKMDKGTVRWVDYRREAGTRSADDDGEDFLSQPSAGDAILCRLNKPLVATCLGLIRRGTPAKIEGRDLGKRLVDHVKKSTELYAFQPLADTIGDVEAYSQREAMKLAAKDREAAAALLQDECDAAILLMERCIEAQNANRNAAGLVKLAEFSDLEALADTLFGDDVKPNSVVTLSSIHKAKGREWRRVFLLGRKDYMPFFKAELQWEIEQEYNLIYVAITRAMNELVYVSGVASAIDKGLHRLPALKAA